MPEVPPQLRSRIEQYQNSRSANALDVAADGSQLLIATRFASTNQLHVVEQPMGMRTQVTFGNEPVNSARFVPGDPRALLYLQDVGGGEFHQVFRLDRRTGRSELLTDGKSRHEGLIVSPTERASRTPARAATEGHRRVRRPDSGPRDAQRVTEREGTWQAVELSRDGKRLLVAQFRAIDDSDLHLYDCRPGAAPDHAAQGEGQRRGRRLQRGRQVGVLITDRTPTSTRSTASTSRGPARNPSRSRSRSKGTWRASPSPDGAHLAFAANEEGWSRVYLLDLRGGAPIRSTARGIVSTLRFPTSAATCCSSARRRRARPATSRPTR